MRTRDTLQQKVWDYIRRNPNFRVGDILMLVPISKHALLEYLLVLKRAHYIKRHSPISTRIKTEDVEYESCKKLGVCAPIVGQNRFKVYDPNTKETIEVQKEDKTESCIYYSKLLGLDDRFLNGYRQKNPELINATAKEVYENYLNRLKRMNETIRDIKKIMAWLIDENLLKEFSKQLCAIGIFNSKDGFSQLKYQLELNRVHTLKKESLEKYEKSIKVFEELYGSIILNKEMV